MKPLFVLFLTVISFRCAPPGDYPCTFPKQKKSPSLILSVKDATDSEGGLQNLRSCQAKVDVKANGSSYYPKGITSGCYRAASFVFAQQFTHYNPNPVTTSESLITDQDTEKLLGVHKDQKVCSCSYKVFAGSGTFTVNISRSRFQSQSRRYSTKYENCPAVLRLLSIPYSLHDQILLAPLQVTGG